MSLDVAPVGPSSFSAANDASASSRVTRPAAAARQRVDVGAIPDRPPREVLDAMDAASRAYQTLRAQGRELRFAQDAQTGRMTIEVRDLDGRLLRMIPPSMLLDVATGGKID